MFVRCVGGTWSVVSRNGQRTFVRDILFALNTMMNQVPLTLTLILTLTGYDKTPTPNPNPNPTR